MRVAILSATARSHGDKGRPCACLPLPGGSVVESQVDLALALGAERIIVIADLFDETFAAAQVRAEKGGARFQILENSSRLPGMVTAMDEVMMLADCVLFDKTVAREALGDSHGVLALPAQDAGNDYERIDADRHWAGLLVARGYIVERLAELPSDSDAISALLRIALQTGVPVREIPVGSLSRGDWTRLKDDAARQQAGARIKSSRLPSEPWTAPGLMLARMLAFRLDEVGNGDRSTGMRLGMVGIVLAGLSLVAGVAGYPAAGMLLLALTALAHNAGQALAVLRGQEPGLAGWLGAAVDLALIALIGFASPTGEHIAAMFAAAMLVGLLRLLVLVAGGPIARLASDRAPLLVLLAFAAIAELAAPAAMVLAAILMALCLYKARSSLLTRV